MFETLLSPVGGRRGTGRRIATLPLAIALHAVAVGSVGLAQLWAIEELPAPAEAMSPVLIVDLPPPPPPPPPPPDAGRNRQDRPTDAPIQPVPVSDGVPAESTPEAAGRPGGVPGGIDNGEDGGIDDGTLGGQPGSTGPTVESTSEIHAVGGRVTAPVLVHRVVPGYPEAARRARLQGVVVIEAVIDREGAVAEARVLGDTARLGVLAEAALRAVREWRYRPALLEGHPVAVRLTLTVTFSLV